MRAEIFALVISSASMRAIRRPNRVVGAVRPSVAALDMVNPSGLARGAVFV